MDEKQREIIAEIQRVAALLNVESLTGRQFTQYSKISESTIKSRFGSWNRAMEAAGLTPRQGRFEEGHGKPILTDDELLQEIIRLSQELGKEPSEHEMSAFGKYSVKPYRDRWGKFSNAKQTAYTQFGFPDATGSVTREANLPKPTSPKREVSNSVRKPSPASNKATKKVQYGEPIDFRGLRHAPINEQGVVYLFGIVSRELGFLIESVRTGYPDDCDVIVCWIHDWADCPLEVIELRSAISHLSK